MAGLAVNSLQTLLVCRYCRCLFHCDNGSRTSVRNHRNHRVYTSRGVRHYVSSSCFSPCVPASCFFPGTSQGRSDSCTAADFMLTFHASKTDLTTARTHLPSRHVSTHSIRRLSRVCTRWSMQGDHCLRKQRPESGATAPSVTIATAAGLAHQVG
ncbi:uncharacterized protein C8Q71DRAFT_242131 [Rhodofomes roseus]|uniref:Secreted protein n=1 Tax=Rhodofomes roseus TaxID=34475 RepID=A0ABQ8K6I6_9APHY|nr:uncharacterized protein C8Q71DRAFT_242131 [Rhodofomes roseus]KAH9832865.1 hypothetical protein C8Q71DRAFT_242131 [Rhodofomes roseus]